jgi:predicted O-methyltransferase YrrM
LNHPEGKSDGAPSAQVTDALQLLRHTSRALAREVRARYTIDLVKWPHRRGFDPLWRTVDHVPGWFPEGTGAVMYALMCSQPPGTVVEIGSYLGRSTVFFALALRDVNPGGRVFAIDPHTGDRQQLEALSADRLPTFELFRHHCRTAGVEDLVEAQVATSLEAAADWSGPVDLLYVDGWHSYDAVVADGEAWLPHLSSPGVVVFDDYAVYDEVREGVHDLAARGLFQLWGSIFGQAIGGVSAVPPASLRRALLLSRGGLRRALGWPRSHVSADRAGA